MARYHDIGPLFLQLLLLNTFLISATLSSPPAQARSTVRAELPSLPLERQLSWHEEQTTGPRCFKVQLRAQGTWWIEVRSTRPATPSLLVLNTDGGEHPRIVERVDGMLLKVCRPGEHLVCLTSTAPLGDVELASTFLKGGDPMEIEVDPNPLATPGCASLLKGGDPMEIEVDPNP